MKRSFSFVLSSLLVVACTVNTSSSSPSAGGATAADVDRCKSGCDKMKFFDCSSADEQARCYADCDKATPSQIQVFAGCAENSICDPSCRTTIQPKDSTQPQGGAGASASTCSTACDKLVSCSLIAIGQKSACNTQCTKSGYQYQVDCVNHTDCGKIASTCGGATSGGTDNGPSSGTIDASVPDMTVAQCQNACDTASFFDCLSASEHTTCRDHCASASASVRQNFTSCSDNAASDCNKQKDCLSVFLK